MNKSVLVLGGGIAGVASSLRLAVNGFKVYLVEREPTIGGAALFFCCKATEACNQCSVCLVPEKIAEIKAQPQISLLTNSQVAEISGQVGDFSVRLIQRPRFVDPEKCTACGVCAELCPSQPNKAIYLPSPQALPYAYAIDKNNCLHFNGVECNICSQECPFGAIDFDRSPEKIELSVDAIIIATGFDVFNAKEKGCLGYGRYTNVLTGLDLEMKFSTQGSITLPSSGKAPQNVAFIQCVGSRDVHIGNGYCSQICCKYAMRFAKLLQYQHPETKITIFYMDLQTAGKGFGEFYQQCKETIRFVRGIPVEISEISPDELEVKYEDFIEGKVAKEIFDLVILSVGITPRKDSSNIARILGINLGEWGFFDTQDHLDSTETNVEGIFVAGTCHGPKDIPESIAHGAQAASKVIQTLAARGI